MTLLVVMLLAACTTASPQPTPTATQAQPIRPEPTDAPPTVTPTSPAGGDTVTLSLTNTGWAAFDSVTADVRMTVLTAGRAPLEWHYEFDAVVVYDTEADIARAEVLFTQLDPDTGELESEERWQKVTTPESFFLLGFPALETDCVSFPNEGLWPLDPSPNGIVPAEALITAESFPSAVIALGPGEAIAGQPTVRYRAPYAVIGGAEGQADLWLWEGRDVVARLEFEDIHGNLTTIQLRETDTAARLALPEGCTPHGTPASPQASRPLDHNEHHVDFR